MKKVRKGIDYTPYRVYTVGEPRAQGSFKNE